MTLKSHLDKPSVSKRMCGTSDGISNMSSVKRWIGGLILKKVSITSEAIVHLGECSAAWRSVA